MSFFFNPQTVFGGPQRTTTSTTPQGAANLAQPVPFPFADIFQALVPIAVHQQQKHDEQQELRKQRLKRCHQDRQHKCQRAQQEPFESCKSQSVPKPVSTTPQQYKIVEQLSDGTIILRPYSNHDDTEYHKQQELLKYQQQVQQIHAKQQQQLREEQHRKEQHRKEQHRKEQHRKEQHRKEQLREEQHRKESEAAFLAFQHCFQSLFQQNEQCVGKKKVETAASESFKLKNDQRKLEKEQTKELLEELFGSSCVIQFDDDGNDDVEKQQMQNQEQEQFPIDQLASLFGLPLSLLGHCFSEPHFNKQEQAEEQKQTISSPAPTSSASIISTSTQVDPAPTAIVPKPDSNTASSETTVTYLEVQTSSLHQNKDHVGSTTSNEPLVDLQVQSASQQPECKQTNTIFNDTTPEIDLKQTQLSTSFEPPQTLNDTAVESSSQLLFSRLLLQNEKLFTKRSALSNKIKLLQQASSFTSSEQTKIDALQHNIQQVDALIAQSQAYTDHLLADFE